MRIRIEGSAEELAGKREQLIRALVEQFEPIDQPIAEALRKALPHKEPNLKHPMLQDLHKLTTEAYEEHMGRMVGAIGKVLDGETVIQKSVCDLATEIAAKASRNDDDIPDALEAMNKAVVAIGKRGGRITGYKNGKPSYERPEKAKTRTRKKKPEVAVKPTKTPERVHPTETAEFKKWFEGSKVVDPDGKPLVVYRGTTADFSTFDRSKANPESDLGAAFYASSSPGDVGVNYAGEGPDLTGKIDQEAERIAQETGREYDDPEVRAEARARWSTHAGATMPLYLAIHNPVILDEWSNGTFLDYEYEAPPIEKKSETLYESDDGVHIELIDGEWVASTDNGGNDLGEFYDLEDALDEARMNQDVGEPSGKLAEFLEAFREQAHEFHTEDSAVTDVIEAVMENHPEGASAAELMETIKGVETFSYTSDLESGALVGNEFLRRVFAEVGFDGFVDQTVNTKFGVARKVGAAMAGVDENTIHYVAFEPEQLKSAIGNRGTFDPKDADITKSDDPPEPGAEPDDPDEDPETGEPKFDPKTGLTPSEAAEEPPAEDGSSDEGEDLAGSEMAKSDAQAISGLDMNGRLSFLGMRWSPDMTQLAKAGPYIGPRGGKWADPDHKIPWREVSQKLQALNTLAHKVGGKVKAHKTDPTKVVLKVPKKFVQNLMDLKQQLKIPHEIILGSKYAILTIDQKSATKPKPKDETKMEVSHASALEIPPYAGVAWSKPTTINEAETWCAKNNIEASFPDLLTAQSVTRALSESHPYVVEHVQFIGTPDQQKAWAKKNPEILKAALSAKHSMDIGKNSPLGGGAVAVAHPLTEKPYTKSMIIVKSGYWSESSATDKKAKVGGFSVSESLGDVIRHELGHVEAFTMRHIQPIEGNKRSMWQVWKDHVVPQLKAGKVSSTISKYASTNPHEAWAELAVLRRRGYAIPGWVQKALGEMKVDAKPWAGMMPSNPWGPQG